MINRKSNRKAHGKQWKWKQENPYSLPFTTHFHRVISFIKTLLLLEHSRLKINIHRDAKLTREAYRKIQWRYIPCSQFYESRFWCSCGSILSFPSIHLWKCLKNHLTSNTSHATPHTVWFFFSYEIPRVHNMFVGVFDVMLKNTLWIQSHMCFKFYLDW